MALMLQLEDRILRFQRDYAKRYADYANDTQMIYPTLVRNAVNTALDLLPTQFLAKYEFTPSSPVLNEIGNVFRPWWEEVADVVRDNERNAYVMVHNVAKEETEKLFDVEYKTVSDDDIDVGLSPDTAKSFDLSSDRMVAEQTMPGPAIEFVLGEGGIDAEFERFLNQMFDAGLDSRNAITTFGEADIARIRSEMVNVLQRGGDVLEARDRVVRQIMVQRGGLASEKVVRYNVHRIMRTTHQRAALASMFSYARRNEYVAGVVRHVGPRPCMACMALEGKVYRTYQEFRDHPNGMCTVTPQLLSTDQILADTELSAPARRAWDTGVGHKAPFRYKFMSGDQQFQKSVLGNDALWGFWRKEDFPIEYFARWNSRGGFFQKASLFYLQRRIGQLGGRSYPKAAFSRRASELGLLETMDAKDRADDSLKIILPHRKKQVNRYDRDRYPTKPPTTEMVLDYPLDVVEEVRRYYPDIETVRDLEELPYFVFNDIMRVIDVGWRKDRENRFYMVEGK